ncbi:uncharacterized protein METZ01_LOCUS340575, partial [marine metagenome]
MRPGDTIALVAPSRPSDPQRLSRAAVLLQDRGY